MICFKSIYSVHIQFFHICEHLDIGIHLLLAVSVHSIAIKKKDLKDYQIKIFQPLEQILLLYLQLLF